eukprot:COSAG02_NODE_40013_length_410_cov_0.665595_1_plen_50_part_00
MQTSECGRAGAGARAGANARAGACCALLPARRHALETNVLCYAGVLGVT